MYELHPSMEEHSATVKVIKVFLFFSPNDDQTLHSYYSIIVIFLLL